MKKFCLGGIVLVLMLFVNNALTAQSVDNLNLMKKYIGTWQASIGKDTVEVWDFKLYGSLAFVVEVTQTICGKKVPVSVNSISYNPEAGKFFGFTLLVGRGYGTWIGSFETDTKFNGDMVQNFTLQPVYGRFENIFKNPNEWTWTGYFNNGLKPMELNFVKVR